MQSQQRFSSLNAPISQSANFFLRASELSQYSRQKIQAFGSAFVENVPRSNSFKKHMQYVSKKARERKHRMGRLASMQSQLSYQFGRAMS